jgi:hypothetical protein
MQSVEGRSNVPVMVPARNAGGRLRRAVGVALLGALVQVCAAHAAAGPEDDCLTGSDPVVASDAAQVRSVRGTIEATCDCSIYDGSDEFEKRDYTRCVLGVLDAELTAGALRAECRKTVLRMYRGSRVPAACGFAPELNARPCVKHNPVSGRTTCSVVPTTKKDGVTPSGKCEDRYGIERDSCSLSPYCVDAMDANADLLVDGTSCVHGLALFSAGAASFVTKDPDSGSLTATADEARSALDLFEIVIDGGSGRTLLQSVASGSYFLKGTDSIVRAEAGDVASATAWVIFVDSGGSPGETSAFILEDGPATSTVGALQVDPGTNELMVVQRNLLDVLDDPNARFAYSNR